MTISIPANIPKAGSHSFAGRLLNQLAIKYLEKFSGEKLLFERRDYISLAALGFLVTRRLVRRKDADKS